MYSNRSSRKNQLILIFFEEGDLIFMKMTDRKARLEVDARIWEESDAASRARGDATAAGLLKPR